MCERQRGIARERGGVTDEEVERRMQKERERMRVAAAKFRERTRE